MSAAIPQLDFFLFQVDFDDLIDAGPEQLYVEWRNSSVLRQSSCRSSFTGDLPLMVTARRFQVTF